MQDELDVERMRLRVVAARRVIARVHLGLAVGAVSAGREEQLHVVVEAEAGEAVEVAAERDADHVRRDLLDAQHVELATARLVAHALRRAGIGFDRGGNRG